MRKLLRYVASQSPYIIFTEVVNSDAFGQEVVFLLKFQTGYVLNRVIPEPCTCGRFRRLSSKIEPSVCRSIGRHMLAYQPYAYNPRLDEARQAPEYQNVREHSEITKIGVWSHQLYKQCLNHPTSWSRNSC